MPRGIERGWILSKAMDFLAEAGHDRPGDIAEALSGSQPASGHKSFECMI